MVWLWGVNLWVFAQSSINYSKIFDLDHNHLTHWDIWKVIFSENSNFLYDNIYPCFIQYTFYVPVCHVDDNHSPDEYDGLHLPLFTR